MCLKHDRSDLPWIVCLHATTAKHTKFPSGSFWMATCSASLRRPPETRRQPFAHLEFSPPASRIGGAGQSPSKLRSEAGRASEISEFVIKTAFRLHFFAAVRSY